MGSFFWKRSVEKGLRSLTFFRIYVTSIIGHKVSSLIFKFFKKRRQEMKIYCEIKNKALKVLLVIVFTANVSIAGILLYYILKPCFGFS